MIRFITLFIAIALFSGGVYVFAADRTETFARMNKNHQIVKIQDVEVKVPVRPQRVAFLTTSSMELWVAAGGADVIIARPSANFLPETVLATLPEDAVNLGTANVISVENVIKQNPDLVIGSAMVNIQQQMARPLQAAGIPMLAMPNYGIDDICEELSLYGMLTGNEEKAQGVIKKMRDNIAFEAKRRENIPKKKVLFVWGTPVSSSMALHASRQGDILQMAGGENIAIDPGTGAKFLPFSLEYAVEADPDFVVFASHGNRKKLEMMMKKILSDSSSWQTIRAIRENRYAVLPPELFAANPGPRIDEAVVYLSRLLYPEDK